VLCWRQMTVQLIRTLKLDGWRGWGRNAEVRASAARVLGRSNERAVEARWRG
jgi:hypothetical protein